LLLVAALVTGCGGEEPRIARADAAPLVTLGDRIARESDAPCAQARDIRVVQARAVRLVNAGRVPAKLQETFLSGVNALAARTPACLPVAAPAPVGTPAAPSAHGHAKKPKHDTKKHGHH
jgi:hypothetical protein